MKSLVLLLSLIISSVVSNAQTRTQLSGRITDATTGIPLPGAAIILVDARLTTIADSSGYYAITNLPLGHTIIEVSFEGFRGVVEHLDIKGTVTHDFALTPAVIVSETVTVTAVGSATSIRRAPVAITRINRSELLATPSTNLIDAISRQPGVSQLTTGPAISKPIIRGLGFNRLVVINDGIRQEGQQWGEEHGIEVDENSVNRIEIVKGPASLIYGSDALAGVINIITTLPAPINTVRGNLLTTYGTNNRQRSFFGNIGGNQGGFSWNAWGDYRAAGDYHNKYDGRVWNSKFNERNVGGHLGINRPWGYSHLIVSSFNQRLGVVEGDRDAGGNFIRVLPGGAEVNPTNSDFNSTSPSVPYQHVRHFRVISDNSFRAGDGRISLNLGWQRNRRQEFGNTDDPGERSLYFDLNTLNYNTAYHFHDNKEWSTTIGLSGMYQRNGNKGVEFLIPEYNLFDIGGFVYAQKASGKTTFSGGLRYDYRSLRSQELVLGGDVKFAPFNRSFSNVTGSLGLSYAASQDVVMKFNLARGFRAPSLPELASNGTHEGTNRYEYGNNNLASETSWQGDLGVEVNTDHVLFTASVFYNSIQDFIYYRRLQGAGGGDSLVLEDNELIPAFRFEQQNARLAGVEMLVDLHPHPVDWLHWQNTFTYVKGTFSEAIDGSKNVPYIPAARLISQARLELLPKGAAFRNLNVFVEVDHTFRQDRPFTAYETETPTPGYTLFNAGITANIMRRNKTLFSIYLLGNNLGDVAYQTHLSRLKYAAVNAATGRTGVFNTGRNIILKLNIPLSFTTR